jgi:DNA polymerase I-like protein with 3'-5' exonuclease and polymerase domains
MISWKFMTLEELEQQIDFDQEVFFDTETDGMYGAVMLAQFYQPHWDMVALVRKPDHILLMALLNKTHSVMHNCSYDLSTMQRQVGNAAWCPEKFEDTLFLARLHFYEKEKFSLDEVMYYALNYDPYKKAGLRKSEMQKTKWSGPLTDDQLMYASIDVYHLPDVYNQVKCKRDDFLYKLDMISLREALIWQTNGFPVDPEALEKKYKENEQAIADEKLAINCNSYQQVRAYIGSDNSDDLGLATEANLGNERAAKVRRTRKLTKQQSFLRKFDSPDNRIFGIFNPSARSGRYTCREQNLQQIPRALKGVFGLDPEMGRVLIYSDYAQLELRAACAITGEKKMETLFREGADLHDYTAEGLFGAQFTKDERQIAKTANFALLYGASHKILGNILLKDCDMLLPESELKSIKNKWNNLWSTITVWQQNGIKRWRQGLIGQTPNGRKYKAKMMTDYLNIQVQGFGSEIAKLAMHYMIKEFEEMGWYNSAVQLDNFVHDSYYWECDTHEPTIRS